MINKKMFFFLNENKAIASFQVRSNINLRSNYSNDLICQVVPSFKKLPSFIGQLNAFQEFDLNGCSELKELPSSISQLNALQKLDLLKCSNLKELPSCINQLNAFQELHLNGCSKLKELLSSIGQLNVLQRLFW
jgi:hypothetical protein